MMSDVQAPRVLRFRMFEVDLQACELRRNGSRIKLQELPFQVLRALVERPGEVVSRQELHRCLWPDDRFVEFEDGLNTAVRKLREALKDDAENPRFIETVPRRGYRFVAAIEEVPQAPPPAVKEEKEEAEGPAARVPSSAEDNRLSPPPSRNRIVVISGFAVLLLVLAGYTWQRTHSQVARPKQRVILAVLPFRNTSADVNATFLADGLTDAVITELGSLHPESLGVIARTSTMQFKNTVQPINVIGTQLGAQYVLDGSMIRSGGRVRITAQLVDVSTQTQLWAQSYERDLRDLISVEGEVALGIAHEIDLNLSRQQKERLVNARSTDPRAYENYLRGRYFWNERTTESIHVAIEAFQQALAIDPNYAPAYAGLADSHLLLASVTQSAQPSQPEYDRAREAAEKALSLDPQLSEAHTSLAMIRFWHDWNWNGAEQEFQRALQLNPSNATAHHWYAIFLSSLGRATEAAAEIRRARELDPLSPIVSADVAWVAFMSRQYNEALRDCQDALTLDPNYPRAHGYVGIIELERGKYDKAREEFAEFRKLENKPSDVVFLAQTYSQAHRTKELQSALREISRLSNDGSPWAYNMALVWTGMGKDDRAFNSLSDALRQREFQLVYLKVDPRLDTLRSDRRFAELVDKVGLPR